MTVENSNQTDNAPHGWVCNEAGQWQFYADGNQTLEAAFYQCVQSAPMSDANWLYLLITATEHLSRNAFDSKTPASFGASIVMSSLDSSLSGPLRHR